MHSFLKQDCTFCILLTEKEKQLYTKIYINITEICVIMCNWYNINVRNCHHVKVKVQY